MHLTNCLFSCLLGVNSLILDHRKKVKDFNGSLIFLWIVLQNILIHHANMSVKCIPPYTPLLYSKTGVYRGILFFLIFAPKHRLWVLVRTEAVLKCTHNQCFEQK